MPADAVIGDIDVDAPGQSNKSNSGWHRYFRASGKSMTDASKQWNDLTDAQKKSYYPDTRLADDESIVDFVSEKENAQKTFRKQFEHMTPHGLGDCTWPVKPEFVECLSQANVVRDNNLAWRAATSPAVGLPTERCLPNDEEPRQLCSEM